MTIQTAPSDDIKNRIYTIRGVQVILDSDLAVLYGVETKRINEAVKRNPKRFPPSFSFILTADEINILKSRSQNATSIMQSKGQKGGRVYLPRVFTEQGIAMLSSVLSSDKAIDVSIEIMNAFVEMRHFINSNALLFQRLSDIDLKLLEHDKNFQAIFQKLEAPREKKASVFSAGQLWDAASYIEDVFRKATKSITVIDKYVDKQTLDLLSKKGSAVSVTVVTDPSCCQLTAQEIALFSKQYGKLVVKYYKKCHDRYIILDGQSLYHCGASLKDAGKQLFSIDLIDEPDVLKLLKDTVKNLK